jgi:glycosyltransferase involved in cell wall biosynthesis
MRLVIATPLYPPELGGPATYAKTLEEGLPPHDVDITIIKFADVRKYPKLIRHIAYGYRVWKATKDADIVLALDPVSTGLPAFIATRLRRKPFVVKVVGDYAWEQARTRFGVLMTLDDFIHEKDTHPFIFLLRTVESFVTKGATRVIVPSRYLGSIIRSWGVSLEHVSVVYNSVPEAALGTVPEEVVAITGPRVVTAGRLVPWKNIGGVIDAVANLPDKEAKLVIVGDGPEREALGKYADSRLPGRVVFTGALSHADTQAVVASASLFVLNSTYEGLSHLLIEALSLGVPIVATRAGGNPEVIEDGVTGKLVPINDSPVLSTVMAEVLADPVGAKARGDAAKKSANRFTRAQMLEGTYAVLASVVYPMPMEEPIGVEETAQTP